MMQHNQSAHTACVEWCVATEVPNRFVLNILEKLQIGIDSKWNFIMVKMFTSGSYKVLIGL